DRVVTTRRVHFGIPGQRCCDRLEDEGVDRRLYAVLLESAVHALAQLHHLRHVALERQIERRDGTDRVPETLRNRLAHLRDPCVLRVRTATHGCRCRRGGRGLGSL